MKLFTSLKLTHPIWRPRCKLNPYQDFSLWLWLWAPNIFPFCTGMRHPPTFPPSTTCVKNQRGTQCALKSRTSLSPTTYFTWTYFFTWVLHPRCLLVPATWGVSFSWKNTRNCVLDGIVVTWTCELGICQNYSGEF